MNIHTQVFIIFLVPKTWYLVKPLPDINYEKFDTQTIIWRMASAVVKEYFQDCYCIVILSESKDFLKSISVPYIRISKLHAQTDDNINVLLADSLNKKCEAFIIQVSHPKIYLLKILKLYKKSEQRNIRKYLILPPSDNYCKSRDVVEDVFEMKEVNFIPDLIVACVNENQNEIKMFTHKFTSQNDSNKIILVDVWFDNNFAYNNNLYPDKTSNLHGKIIPFATTIYLPYATVDEELNYDGTEVRIAIEFSKKLNGTPTYVIDMENEFGEVYDNDTGNGLLGNLAEDNAEIGFASLGVWCHEYQHLDMAFPYIRTAVTCLTPKPKLLPGWMTVWLPFSVEVWFCVLPAIFGSAVAHLIFSKSYKQHFEASSRERSFGYSLFLVYGFLLSQATVINETGSPSKHLINWLAFTFMLITSSYSSGLASILTIPRYESPIDTMLDLAESNMVWAATHEAWAFSLRGSTDNVTRHVYLQFRVFKEEQLKRKAFTGDTAFAIERLQAGHYAVGSYITEESVPNLRIMKEDVYWVYVTSYARKGSCFIEKYNSLIHRLRDSGLILAFGRTSREEEHVQQCPESCEGKFQYTRY